MTNWDEDPPIVDSRILPPDPQLMETIGLNHALESALADLVDNSIDARAQKILIRFVRRGDTLVGIYVVDDGDGMDEQQIDKAMTLGDRRSYKTGDLGHFGVGLKAASLGQAKSLSVFSREKGKQAVGRRWLIERGTTAFACDVLDSDFAEGTLNRDWRLIQPTSGTIVRLDQVKSFPKARSASVTDRYLEDAFVRLRQHLGLVFHRILEQERVQITIDVEDAQTGETGAPFVVEPLDPFGYLRSGHHQYPRTLLVDVDDNSVDLRCHIWPGRSQLPNFRLPGGKPEVFQGFFFYRFGRLLQIGGWNGVTHPEKHYQMARVEIHLDENSGELFSMNPEKTRLEARSEFIAALLDAKTADGFSFATYLADAQSTYKEAQTRNRSRGKVFPPGPGLHGRVRRAIGRELESLPNEQPIEIRWARFETPAFLEVDREEGVIWLNKRYRAALNRDRPGSLSDVPMVKTLIYLLMEDLFHGAFLGSKDKDNIELWTAILTAAAETELRNE